MAVAIQTDARYRAALSVARRLREAGHQAYFAGGCVRDLLLGVAPKDYDVATSATPDEVIALFSKTFAVGAHFGVVLVCETVDGVEIATEVATFRNDGAYSDGRRPDAVRFSTEPREDVLRRDFTINGMLLDPEQYEAAGDAAAATLDFVHGREDLAARHRARHRRPRRCALRRTSCGCCARCGLRRGCGSRSIRQRPRRSAAAREIRAGERASGCAMS